MQTIRYVPSEENVRRTVRDYYLRVLLREKLGLGVLLLFIVVSFATAGWIFDEPAGIIFSGIIAILVTAAWIKSYMGALESALAELRLSGGEMFELRISESGIEFQSSKTKTSYSWSDFTGIIQTKHSLILLNNRVPVLFLSREILEKDQLEHVRSHVPPDLQWRKRTGQPRAPTRKTVILLLLTGILLVLAGYGYWSLLRVQLSAGAFMDEALHEILRQWSGEELLDRASEEFMLERPEAEIRSDLQEWRRLGPLVSFVDEKEWVSRSVSSQDGRKVTAHRVVQAEFVQGLAEIHLIVIQKGELWEILSFEVEKIPKEQELE